MSRPFMTHLPDMLYIHWPFCASKCHYCDFVAMEGHDEFSETYHQALCNEIRSFVADRADTHRHKIKTIFFGGGTPSLYPLPLLRELFALLNECFDLSEVQECSLEVNPGGQTEEHFATWKELGINRLSVGVQVLDDAVLEKLNRPQKTADVQAFFQEAPKYIENLSADLIIGLPGVTEQVWRTTVQETLFWPISHVSLYFLTVHQHTQLYHGVKAGKIHLPIEDSVIAQYEWTTQRVEKRGLQQYEISNFALPGKECIHNQGYWQRQSYRGFGLGAASYDGRYRFANIRNLGAYTKAFSHDAVDNDAHYSYQEKLSDHQHQMEQVMLGLRQRTGVDLHDVVYLSNRQTSGAFFSAREELKKNGYLVQTGSVIRLTRKGQIFENEVIVKLCRGLEGDHHETGRSEVTTMNAD